MAQRVRVVAASGSVHVTAEERTGIDTGGATVTGPADDRTVLAASSAIRLRVPTGTDVTIGSASGNVTLEGPLGAVHVTTASGNVEAADVASIDARTISGKLRVGTARGPVRLRAKSATIRIGRADGEVRAASVSGGVHVDDARAGVSAKTVSGRIEAALTEPHDAGFETISGRITVRLPEGARPDLRIRTLSGKRRIECETGEDLTLTVRTISGSITVRGPS